jgi:hypothetical protein
VTSARPCGLVPEQLKYTAGLPARKFGVAHSSLRLA